MKNFIVTVLFFAAIPFCAQAETLGLTTIPGFVEDTSGEFPKRYVFIKKGESVSFDANTSWDVYSLFWYFSKGSGSPVEKSGEGPHSIIYGQDAVGKINTVEIKANRTDENEEDCETKKKRTCAVIIPEIEFQTSLMATPGHWKVMDPLNPQVAVKIGVLVGDTINFRMKPLSEPLTIADSNFAWSGEASGAGKTISVTFSTSGEKQIKFKISGHETNVIDVSVRPVPSGFTEVQYGLALAASSPAAAGIAIVDKNKALAWRPPGGGANVNDLGDAERHCYWQAITTRDLGSTIAGGLGMAHEVTGLTVNPNRNEPVMDLDNNATGRGLTSFLSLTSDATLQTLTVTTGSSGSLRVFDDPTNDRSRGLLRASP